MNWWDVIKSNDDADASDLSPKDLARLRTGLQCPECKRRFLSEQGLESHHCRKPINFNEDLTPDENREMADFMRQFGVGLGDKNCPACKGEGEVDGEPCPVCR